MSATAIKSFLTERVFMMGTERYPELRPALPTHFVKPSKTAKVLTPAIVFATVCVLACASVVGVAVTGSVLGGGAGASGMRAAQAVLLVASLLTILYLGFHLAAAVGNEPVGVIRPPVLRIHANCFIVARLALLFWVVAMIASSVVASKPNICKPGTRDCNLQIVGVVAATLAFIATGMLLTALESCHYPFQMPEVLNMRLITCRVSAFGDDIAELDRSVSQVSFYREESPIATEKDIGVNHKRSVKRKAVPENPIHIPGEWPQERPITPLLPMVHRLQSRGWGEEWTWTPAEDDGAPKKGLKHSDSAISMAKSDSSSGYGRSSSGYARSSSGYARSSSGYASTSDPETRPRTKVQKRQRARTVTPRSSISNVSRRSPLSTVRSADFPELVVRPELRYSSPYEWRLSQAASMSQLLPVADIHALRRRSSNTPPSLRLREPSKSLPPIPGSPVLRRKSTRLRIPGSYVDSYHEQVLDEHIRKIEVEGIIRRQSQLRGKVSGSGSSSGSMRTTRRTTSTIISTRTASTRISGPGFERHYAPKAVEVRYREQSRSLAQEQSIKRSQTSASSPPLKEAAQVAYVKGKALRRLSLGDIETGFGNMWEV